MLPDTLVLVLVVPDVPDVPDVDEDVLAPAVELMTVVSWVMVDRL